MWPSVIERHRRCCRRPRASGGLGEGQTQLQVLSRRLALRRERESFVVVLLLPGGESWHGRLEIGEGMAAPELLLVNAVTAFDLAVLLGKSCLDVPTPDPGFLNAQRKGQREIRDRCRTEASGWGTARRAAPRSRRDFSNTFVGGSEQYLWPACNERSVPLAVDFVREPCYVLAPCRAT